MATIDLGKIKFNWRGTYAAFEETFIGPSGLSFSINTSGNLIMTV